MLKSIVIHFNGALPCSLHKLVAAPERGCLGAGREKDGEKARSFRRSVCREPYRQRRCGGMWSRPILSNEGLAML